MIAYIALLATLGANPAKELPQVTARRIALDLQAPSLDGRLDDAVWQGADAFGDFVQMEPNEGEPARFRTTGWIAFDDEAVYVAIRMYDPEPEKIMAQLTRRDADSPSDWIYVGFDSRRDRRTSYVFGVNPLGVKKDFIFAEGNGEDESWDAVWEVATARDAEGWTAEYRIPLSALRFSTGGDGVWGFQAGRMVQREREFSFWSPMKRDEPRPVAIYGQLRGMTGLSAPRRLEVLPYSVSGLTRAPGDAANPFYAPTDWTGTAGVDIKYGITSNLTLDLTLNPDFGQVEADPSQVNLSAFETYLSEQRPFFTEGADIFRFGLGLGDEANEQLFYSRRVGRSPQLGADSRGGYVDAPTSTTILGAAKLSGKTAGGWSVGVLNALTGQELATVKDSLGVVHQDVVEPLTSYSVLRLRRDLNEGRTQVGIVGTGVVRDLDEQGAGALTSSAFAGGMDFSHTFLNDQWVVRASFLGSRVEGSTDAILHLQNSSRRYYGRSDADHLQVDETATDLMGWSGNYMVGKTSGRWRGGILGEARSPGFEVNDAGYQREADHVLNAAYMGYREFTPGKWLRNWGVNTNFWTGHNFGGERVALGGNVNGNVQFLNYWGAYAGVNRNQPGLNTRGLRGGPALVTPGQLNGWLGFHTDGRKRVSYNLNGGWALEDESDGYSYNIGTSVGWRVSEGARLSFSPFYRRSHNDWQYVRQPQDVVGTRHYVFGELDQHTVGASLRLNQTFTPNLSLQLYAQPFVAAGEYASFKEVTDSRAEAYSDRFRPYGEGEITRCDGFYGVDRIADGCAKNSFGYSFRDPSFNVRELNLNAVLRWEYRLGSTVYFVWSHGRSGFEPDGRFSPRNDLGALLDVPSTNVFMVKANWWLSF